METRNNVAFSFYLRRTRLNKNGEAPIIVKITANGTKDEIAVLRNISPEKWSTEKNGATVTALYRLFIGGKRYKPWLWFFSRKRLKQVVKCKNPAGKLSIGE